MSVKKMEEYKKYKANRKEILAKEKMRKKRNTIIGYVVAVAIVCVFAFTIYLDVKPEATDNTYKTLVNWNNYTLKEETDASDESTDNTDGATDEADKTESDDATE